VEDACLVYEGSETTLRRQFRDQVSFLRKQVPKESSLRSAVTQCERFRSLVEAEHSHLAHIKCYRSRTVVRYVVRTWIERTLAEDDLRAEAGTHDCVKISSLLEESQKRTIASVRAFFGS
jgi:hypothetical protein